MRSACLAGHGRRDYLEAQATDGAEVAPLATGHSAGIRFALFTEPLTMTLEDIFDVGLAPLTLRDLR